MNQAPQDGYNQDPLPFEDWVTHVNTAKRKIRSELSLEDWQKYGFGRRRAHEFEALAFAADTAVPREKHGELSVEEFWEKYEKPGRPCLIYGVPQQEGWACERWRWDDFFKRFGQSHFKVGKDDHGQTVRLRADYFEQYTRTQQDDSPVYLFDNHFRHEKKAILQDYHVPSYFPDDYMSFCEDDRPPYRWVGVGPPRSGTIMHQDPLCTSAWNTLLLGRKLWLLLAPDTPKRVAKGKDVMQPEDDDEACNHFLDLLPRKRARQDPDFQPILCVQHPGETIFVPGNWWHCVVNLDDTIAVTQNYVGRHNFPQVWRSCRVERPCWSHRWLRCMEAKCPDLAAWAKRLNVEDGFDMNELRQKNRMRLLQHRRRRALNALKRAKQRSAAKGLELDEQAFLVQWQDSQEAINSDSTASTTSSDSSETSASS